MQYVPNPSLFLDEAMLAVSIVSRSFADLVRMPLQYDQVAPPFYLLATKAMGFAFGYGEYALRSIALVSSIAALILFVQLSRLTLTRLAIPFAVFVFSISPALVNYSAMIKPYSTDVLASVAISIVSIRLVESRFSIRYALRAALLGAVTVWFSQASVIVLGALAPVLIGTSLRKRESHASNVALAVTFVWGVASIVSVLWTRSMMTQSTHNIMQAYWSFAFMPFPPHSLIEWLWPWRILRGLYWNALNMHAVASLALLFGIWGVLSFWRRGRMDIMLVLFSPLIFTIVLSAAALYPFSGRLLLFILPAMVIALAEGIRSVTDLLPARIERFWPLLPVVFLVPSTFVTLRDLPPWRTEEMKPVLTHLMTNRIEGDGIYVFRLAIPAMQYYAPRFGLIKSDWIAIQDGRTPQDYLLDREHSSQKPRVWLVFSHDNGIHTPLINYMDSVAQRVDSVAFPQKPEGSMAYLFQSKAHPDSIVRPAARVHDAISSSSPADLNHIHQ
jgi:hypothetical protein